MHKWKEFAAPGRNISETGVCLVNVRLVCGIGSGKISSSEDSCADRVIQLAWIGRPAWYPNERIFLSKRALLF